MSNEKPKNTAKQDLMEQILLHLADSIDFGCSYNFKKGIGISGELLRSFVNIEEKNFRNSINNLRKQKFIEKKENYDKSIVISLTEKGKLRALNLRFHRLSNKKEIWDGKWRMVAFDIPEECKKGRNALRYRLKSGGFYELQESLFLYPFDCKKEIEDFIKLFKLEKYVHFGLLDFMDNQEKLKVFYKLSGNFR